MKKLSNGDNSFLKFLYNKSSDKTKENEKEIIALFDKIPKKKMPVDEFKIINDNINLIRAKYSDECLYNLSVITKKINDLRDNREIVYPQREIGLNEIIKMVLDYYKKFSDKDYAVLQKKIGASGDQILDWNMLKAIQGDKTLNIYPTIVHQFRHIIEDDYRSPSYNVLSNTLAIFNEINCIDDISKNNPEYSILKYKRIRTLESISIFMNNYIKILMSNTVVDKKTIESLTEGLDKNLYNYDKILKRMYDLDSFQTDIKNIVSTLKAIELTTQFREYDTGEVKLELNAIYNTFKGEEISIANDRFLNTIGANVDSLIDNMEYYEDYVGKVRDIKLDKVK